MDEKQCSKCGITKPHTEFHKAKRGKFGIKSCCKACHSARWTLKGGYISPASIKQKGEVAARPHNKCICCGTEFNAYSGKEYCSKPCAARYRRAINGPELRARSRARYRDNPKIRETKKRYAQRPENVIKQRERNRIHKYKNPDAVLRSLKPYDPKTIRFKRMADRSDGTVTAGVIRRLNVEKHCAYCLIELNADNRQIDHVTPLAKGGIHSSSNLVAACKSCNQSKGAKMLWQWLQVGNFVYNREQKKVLAHNL